MSHRPPAGRERKHERPGSSPGAGFELLLFRASARTGVSAGEYRRAAYRRMRTDGSQRLRASTRRGVNACPGARTGPRSSTRVRARVRADGLSHAGGGAPGRPDTWSRVCAAALAREGARARTTIVVVGSWRRATTAVLDESAHSALRRWRSNPDSPGFGCVEGPGGWFSLLEPGVKAVGSGCRSGCSRSLSEFFFRLDVGAHPPLLSFRKQTRSDKSRG